MRVVVLALVLSLGACADDDGSFDYCHDENGNPTNDVGCEPASQSVETTTRWSFETLDGSVKAPCLPGEPPVTVHFSSARLTSRDVTAACATGAVTVTLDDSYFERSLSSHDADREYRSLPSVGSVTAPDLPTLVVYTDAGYATANWTLSCESHFITNLRVFVDDAAFRETDCRTGGANIGPLLEGPHSLRADALDVANNVILTSNVVDVDVLAGGFVGAALQFTAP